MTTGNWAVACGDKNNYADLTGLAKIRWRGLEVDRVIESRDGKRKDNPDLSKVDEIGFTDLTLGTGHGAGGSSRVGWIEVYGNTVKRPLTAQRRQ